MQDLTLSLAEEEYDGIDDEEEFEYYEGEGTVSQMRFLSGKKRKITYEELNVSTESPPPLPQNYEPRDFRQLTQLDGNGHLPTSVATTSAQVGFKCRSVLVNLCEMYLILIEIPHLKHKLKATNLMSLFDCKIENSDNQVIVSMVEHWWATTHTFHLPCGELGITPRYFTVHTGIGIETGEPMVLDESYTEYGNTLRIFPDMESKDYEKGCISFVHLQNYLDHIRYWCYEYCQIGHHILIDNRLDNFWPRMSGWHIKRQKLTENKAKRHLALMRQQLDLRTMNNMQWDPFRNMKNELKWEHRAVPYNPLENLHCFSSPDVVRSLRAAGWIEAQYYIVGHHVEYDAYWRHISYGALMSDITRCCNIDIPGIGTLTARVTFPHVEFSTGDFSTQETQIPPPQLDLRRTKGHLSQLNDYLNGEGIVVDWEDDEGEAGTSQAGTSRARGSRGRSSRGRTFESGDAPPRQSR
ncbi:hypothetical protein GIB67_041424, partial [Kingdonia uniflora]